MDAAGIDPRKISVGLAVMPCTSRGRLDPVPSLAAGDTLKGTTVGFDDPARAYVVVVACNQKVSYAAFSTETDRRSQHARTVASAPQTRYHVITEVSSGLEQRFGQLMTHDNGSDVLVSFREPQLGHGHAPELSSCAPMTHESIEVGRCLIEMHIRRPLVATHLPFTTEIRVLDF
jgi:hypothetical protein